MKIGIYLHRMKASVGGGYTFLKNIISALATYQGSHSIFIFYEKMEGTEIKETENIKLIRIKKNKRRLFNIFRKEKDSSTPLAKAVKEHNIELMWYVTPVYEEAEVPYITTLWDLEHRVHPYFPEVSSSGWTWNQREDLYKSVLPRAAYVITGTNVGREEAIKFYCLNEYRVKVVPFPTPNYVKNNQNASLPKIISDLNQPYLFYPAQFWPHKNHIAILLAVKILKERHGVSFRVVFTGSDQGNLPYIQKKIEELQLSDSVHLLGFVSEAEVVALYKNAFALVYMSLFGPDNLPPLEAFGMGCPVIASDIAGAREQLKEAAILVDPCNEHNLAHQIFLLTQDERLRKQKIDRGLEISNDWTTQDYIKKVFEYVEEFSLHRRTWN